MRRWGDVDLLDLGGSIEGACGRSIKFVAVSCEFGQ